MIYLFHGTTRLYLKLYFTYFAIITHKCVFVYDRKIKNRFLSIFNVGINLNEKKKISNIFCIEICVVSLSVSYILLVRICRQT